MVALISAYVRLNGRWLNYLLLSVCVNALIAFSVNLGNATQAVPALPILKVNLMALPAPAHVSTLPASTLPAPTPETKHEKKHEKKQAQKIVTEKQAVAKLAAIQPLAKQESANDNAPPRLTTSHTKGTANATVIHEATYRRQTPPIYPPRALELGQQGIVTLHAKVTPNGLPHMLKVAHSSGYRLLDKAALAAVKQWEFEPTHINGRPVTSWLRVPVHFVIQ